MLFINDTSGFCPDSLNVFTVVVSTARLAAPAAAAVCDIPESVPSPILSLGPGRILGN